ncbi:unnamed protein product [Acanthosepion pharaonis]|uniref:Uncharacterized protein n=1 Tax=Acanthosepion pharaonis TaxID=158019 RepID=A0A812ASV6_ACAPH|nr:unnamed protein product [Sepia pharaonis]
MYIILSFSLYFFFLPLLSIYLSISFLYLSISISLLTDLLPSSNIPTSKTWETSSLTSCLYFVVIILLEFFKCSSKLVSLLWTFQFLLSNSSLLFITASGPHTYPSQSIHNIPLSICLSPHVHESTSASSYSSIPVQLSSRLFLSLSLNPVQLYCHLFSLSLNPVQLYCHLFSLLSLSLNPVQLYSPLLSLLHFCSIVIPSLSLSFTPVQLSSPLSLDPV